jgi:hypothetical protein
LPSVHEKNQKFKRLASSDNDDVSMRSSASKISKGSKNLKKPTQNRQSSSFMTSKQPVLLDASSDSENEPDPSMQIEEQRMIGPISEQDRLSKVRRYLNKKRNK